MGPLGSRGLSQLRCRESGLRAVKTSGPGAQGVLRVKGVPARAQGACQNHSKGSLRGMCTQHLWSEPEELSSLDECKASMWGRRSCSKMRGRKGELKMWQGERKQPGQHCRQQQRHLSATLLSPAISPGTGLSGLCGSTWDSMVMTPSLSGPQPSSLCAFTLKM